MPQAICLVEITPGNNPGTDREILPYLVLESPGVTLHGYWATPVVMEYNYRVREYCIIIHIKYLNYSDSLSVNQTQLNNLQHH